MESGVIILILVEITSTEYVSKFLKCHHDLSGEPWKPRSKY